MIDIAIGVIIGAAFNKVIEVLVKEIFLPPLSFMTNSVNLENKKWVLRPAVLENGKMAIEEVAIGYGKLLEAGIDFLIIGFTVFLVVKATNAIKKRADNPDDESVKTPKDIELLHKMTELLEQQNALLKKSSKAD